jgi:hypothetical protein
MQTTYHRLRVELGKKDLQQIAEMLKKGWASARVLRRALILRQLDQGQAAAQVGDNVGVAPKTVRAIARRYEEEGLESALYEKPRNGKQRLLDIRPESADYCHGVQSGSRRPGPVERAAHRRGGRETKTGSTRRPGDHPHPSSRPRAEAVAGEKAGAWRN